MKISHFPETRERRFLNVKASPNIEMLGHIRDTVEKAAHAGATVAITGPWDGAILTAIDDLDIVLVAVDKNPSDILVKIAKETGAVICDKLPSKVDILIIDSALLGNALKDAEKAVKGGIGVVLVHNTSPKLANLPEVLRTGNAAARFLHSKGYKLAGFQTISLDGGRRGLETGTKAEWLSTPADTQEEVPEETPEVILPAPAEILPVDSTPEGEPEAAATATQLGPDSPEVEPQRARDEDGQFTPDNPDTAENEAYDPPTKPAKKAAKKAAKKVAKKG
jgi:hypothetical protein